MNSIRTGFSNVNWADQPPRDDQPSFSVDTVAELRRALAACASLPEPDRTDGMMFLLDANLDLRDLLSSGAREALEHALRSSGPREVAKASRATPRLSLSDTVKRARAIAKDRGELPKIDAELIPQLVAEGATHRTAHEAASIVRREHNVPIGRRRTRIGDR